MTQIQPTAITPRPAGGTASEPDCCVCGEPVDKRHGSACRSCDQPVHIAWAQEQPESPCSRIAPTPTACGVSFVCTPCYGDLDFA